MLRPHFLPGARALAARAALAATALLPLVASAGEQADRAVAMVRQMVASGEVRPGTALRLGFKQGNINAFLGRDSELRREWERLTGVVLDARLVPQQAALETLQGKAAAGLDLTVARNHEYPDLLAENLIVDLGPLLSELGFELDANPGNGFIRPDLQARVGESVAAIPADGDLIVLYLRRDLMEDPREKAAFQKAFNRPLAPPRTWSEYEDLIRFFHRPEAEFYGAAEERDPSGAWMFWLPRYLVEGKPWRPLFDAQMRPLIDSPAGIAATESYVATVRHSPPGITDAGKGYNHVVPLFVQGKAFSVMNTVAAVKSFNVEGSRVRDRVMAVPLPGKRHGSQLVRRNTIIYGNNLVVPQTAANPKLALLYALWLTDPDISARSISVPGGFADPYRWNHLRDPRVVENYGAKTLETFAGEWAVTLPPGTGLPGDGEYLAALDRNLTAAARGEITAAQAMQRTASEWNVITTRFGWDNQVRRWQAFSRRFGVEE